MVDKFAFISEMETQIGAIKLTKLTDHQRKHQSREYHKDGFDFGREGIDHAKELEINYS